ncbi:MAG: NAD(P)(+) transhydrogenase (Re/Si-specific) subunit beta [Trueperaceae bacterium]|nr:NAD(P)(+) transhydrogenase (Re/Si-specific) subunit beta [Trueperaceae bacterium]
MPVGVQLGYIAAAVLFILGLKMLGRADTARRGNLISAAGMLLAVVVTLLQGGMEWTWIIIGLVVGGGVGAIAARAVAMTAMPEMVALFNGSGGLASLLVAWAEYHDAASLPVVTGVAVVLAALIGGIAASGSVIAFGKLSEKLPGRPIRLPQQTLVMILLGLITIGAAVWFLLTPSGVVGYLMLMIGVVVALVLGVLLVLPIGGADMPIAVSLLNAYSGIAAAMAGFVLGNSALVVAGSLVGAAGLILTQIMCKSMNRSLFNVLFAGFGGEGGMGTAVEGEPHPLSPEDAYYVLEAASNVVFVPGYGMAVAQAQHAVKELADLLQRNGAEVRYAIHPVAGRMPGHMNVLLAEANVPYEQLVEPEDVNPTMESVDVAIVIGANDVVNPAAREDDTSPLYGMPTLEVDRARTVFVLKRSMGAGFSGVGNALFVKDNTRMLFGDAKATLTALVSEFKEALGVS